MCIKEIALEFVNCLVPDKFEFAKEMIPSNCLYKYGNKRLRGDSIIQSFVDNHENAKRKLDKIEYIDGRVDFLKGNFVIVIVQDKIEKAGDIHIYTDRLVIEVKEALIVGIEYLPFEEERKKIKEFLEKVSVELQF